MRYKARCKLCNKVFTNREKGSKFKPIAMCPECNRLNEIITCLGCKQAFKRKDGWLDECYECETPVCSKCGHCFKVGQFDFCFCKEHKNPDREYLKQENERLIEELAAFN